MPWGTICSLHGPNLTDAITKYMCYAVMNVTQRSGRSVAAVRSQVSHIASLEFPKVLQVCANKLRDDEVPGPQSADRQKLSVTDGRERSPGALSGVAKAQDEAAEAEPCTLPAPTTNGVEAGSARDEGGLSGKAVLSRLPIPTSACELSYVG
eukprot:s9967_g1.t1